MALAQAQAIAGNWTQALRPKPPGDFGRTPRVPCQVLSSPPLQVIGVPGPRTDEALPLLIIKFELLIIKF